MDTAPAPDQNQVIELLVGTYTGEESEGIYLFDFDTATGEITNKRLVAETANPSYLTISKDRQLVCAVNEGQDGKVTSFKWNAERDRLALVSQQPSQGDYPCYVDLNGRESLLAIGNYLTGNFLIYNIDPSGVIQEGPTVRQHEGSGPFLPNQESAHAHCAIFDPNDQFLYAVDLGSDQIATYPISNGDRVGELSSSLKFDLGDGPRHMIFHPIKNLAFAVNELSQSVVSLQIDHSTGRLEKVDKASTVPEGFEGKNFCADIHLSADSKFLYASNRGHNSIAIFSISETGELELIGTESVRGDWPRNFVLSPNGKYLLVANQNSNNITVFAVNPETGLLSYTDQEIALSKPVVMKF